MLQRWSQVRRIKKRALNGPSDSVFVKEFVPLVEEQRIYELVSRRQLVDEKNREAIHQNKASVDSAIRDKLHQWALSRALTTTGVFSPVERRFIRIKMNFILTATKNEKMDALKGLEKKLGRWRYSNFMALYNNTINFLENKLNSY